MPPTLPPVRPHRPKPVISALGVNSATGLPQRHGLKPSTNEAPLISSSPESLGTESPLESIISNESTPSRLRALQVPPSLWTMTVPNLTLPLLLFAIASCIGFALVSIAAAPLPNITLGLMNTWQQANNVTSPSYAHVWDVLWYRPQIPWAIACGAFLGPWSAMAAAGLWLLLSIAGLPLMASGGGPELLVSPVFGFSLGLVAAAGVAGLLTSSTSDNPNQSKLTTKPSVQSGHDSSLTLLQRAQVPSLVSLRRQKKLTEKRQHQKRNPNRHPIIQWFSNQGGLSSIGPIALAIAKRTMEGFASGIRAIRPCPQRTLQKHPFLAAIEVGQLLLVSAVATTTAHALGWAFLGILSLQFISSVLPLHLSPVGFQFISHWGQQLSILSWSYDVIFAFCGLLWVQAFRRVFGIVLFD